MNSIGKYEERGDPIHFSPDFKKNPEPFGEPLKELLECFDDLPHGSSVLDIAGGYGRYAVPLFRAGFNVTITDIDHGSMEEAVRRKRLYENETTTGQLRVVEHDVLRQPMPDGIKYDCVFSAGFLHHLSKDAFEDCVKKMASALSENGTIVFEFSTNKDRREPSGKQILIGNDPEQNCAKAEGLSLVNNTLSICGFKNVSTEIVKLSIRQPDFCYDADVIVVKAVLDNA